jgi:hypothetical protein
MKNLLTSLVLSFISISSFAQSNYCDFDEELVSIKSQDTIGYLTAKAAHTAAVTYYRKHHPGIKYLASPVPCDNCLQMDSACPKAHYLLPVVVHVIHLPSDGLGQGSNISQTQIENQLDLLNKYFRNYFADSSINTGIQFCLAKKKPDGSPFDGINRIASDSSNMHRNNKSELTSLIHYPTDQYINIYIVNGMLDNFGNPINVAGFANYPYYGSRALDAIVVRADWFGDYTQFNTLNS